MKAERAAKADKCILCGKTVSSFCKSHSIPQMVLKSIANNGMLLTMEQFFGMPIIDETKGVGTAGVFYLICEECDSARFQSYESYRILDEHITDTMMAQIAMKNTLQMLYKRAVERELYKILVFDKMANMDLDKYNQINAYDCRDFMEELEISKRLLEIEGDTNEYRIMFHKVLPYMVPMAFQGLMSPYKDLDGRIINNKYASDPSLRISLLHLLVFPYEGKSLILAFYHRRNNDKYRRMTRTLKSILMSCATRYLCYRIIADTENYYLSPTMRQVIEENDSIERLVREEDEAPMMSRYLPLLYDDSNYNPVSMHEIPDLLSERYAIA